MISIISPTIREKCLPIVAKAIRRQSFRDFEWIVGSKYDYGYGEWVEDDFEDGVWTLNRIYNKLIKKAKGDLIVSWQDYTFADPDCLDKFNLHYKMEPKTIVSAVGNKYSDDTFTVKTWQDPRETFDHGAYYECYPWDIEANLCSIPKQALYDIGGFDENMDFEGYGFDARGVFERLDYLDYKFKIDQSLKSYSLEHSRADDWDDNNMIDKWIDYKKKMFDNNKYPVLDYLI